MNTKESLAAQLGAVIEEEVKTLHQQGYLQGEHELSVSDDYVFTRLSQLANHDAIGFEEYSYDRKEEAGLNIDDAISLLERFTTIEDQHECWIINHQVRP